VPQRRRFFRPPSQYGRSAAAASRKARGHGQDDRARGTPPRARGRPGTSRRGAAVCFNGLLYPHERGGDRAQK
jgi:hypothetical protein